MMVYGDPQFACSSSKFLEWLGERLERIDAADLDQVRTLLIHAGQLEQGISDAEGASSDWIAAGAELTDALAVRFYDVFRGSQCSRVHSKQRIAESVRRLRQFPDRRLQVKVPEGFEFYTLFPEQYSCAADEFAQRHAADSTAKRAIVVGIRSIGSTLSALVKVSLQHRGWQAQRLTVRPHGDPWQRRAEIALPPGSWGWGLIVDEGPGISGSSMAAVGEALLRCGIARERIAFFPGHGGRPGPAASAEVREWWKSSPRYFVSLDELRWDGCTFRKRLLSQSARRGYTGNVMEDLSGGLWRNFAFASDCDWPAACIAFERAKFLVGDCVGRRVLWKFNGFGSLRQPPTTKVSDQDARCDQWDPRSSRPRVVVSEFGFVGTSWVEGVRLKPSDREQLLPLIVNHICACQGELLSADEQRAALDRLAEMMLSNIVEHFGKSYAKLARRVVAMVDGLSQLPCYGDGRMGPWEWVRDRSGRIWKTDVGGHSSDHTMVGRQPLLWDVAGPIVEWCLSETQTLHFVSELQRRGIPIVREHLVFFEVAYAAFRLGQTSVCASVCASDDSEAVRLRAAASWYAAQVKTLLNDLGMDPACDPQKTG